jgi:hypothetical protein
LGPTSRHYPAFPRDSASFLLQESVFCKARKRSAQSIFAVPEFNENPMYFTKLRTTIPPVFNIKTNTLWPPTLSKTPSQQYQIGPNSGCISLSKGDEIHLLARTVIFPLSWKSFVLDQQNHHFDDKTDPIKGAL